MKTVEEAVSVRNWVLERIEVASVLEDADARRRALTFVIVGGGFAGVETISELEDMAREAVNRNDRLTPSDLRFVMIEAAPRIMPEVPEDRAEKVVAELRARGIEILLNTSLSDATGGNLQLINMAWLRALGLLAITPPCLTSPAAVWVVSACRTRSMPPARRWCWLRTFWRHGAVSR